MLFLADCPGITPTSLESLAALPKLQRLSVDENPQLDNAALSHIVNVDTLTQLGLTGTSITDEGLAQLAQLTELRHISLAYTGIGDAGLAHLAKCENLETLRLNACSNFTDDGLAALRNLRGLRLLVLDNNPGLTQRSVDTLAAMSQLEELSIRLAAVSEEDARRLHRALPDCTIMHQSGAFGPVDYAAQREIAEWVRSIGGNVAVQESGAGAGEWRWADGELPEAAFRVTGISLSANDQVTDADMQRMVSLEHLRWLHVGATGITDQGVEPLANLVDLRYLILGQTEADGDSLQHLSGMTKMSHLALNGLKIASDNLQHLTAMSELTHLDLRGTQVDDAAIDALAAFKQLTRLLLAGTGVTATGIERLQAALPECEITWDGK